MNYKLTWLEAHTYVPDNQTAMDTDGMTIEDWQKRYQLANATMKVCSDDSEWIDIGLEHGFTSQSVREAQLYVTKYLDELGVDDPIFTCVSGDWTFTEEDELVVA